MDHPRSRGVYTATPIVLKPELGSSPLARGLLVGDRRGSGNVRIIPARAGFTTCCCCPILALPDHPRSRGVYILFPYTWKSVGGSSPLARGLRDWGASELTALGIIPARAGFTTMRPTAPVSTTDHPRSRGVYCTVVMIRVSFRGSSPLARGLHVEHTTFPTPARIIPARAGFTTKRLVMFVIADGSSPLARGLRCVRWSWWCVVGIIPARAGFTTPPAGGPDLPRDHPRSRGVYAEPVDDDIQRQGSSPLARGLRANSGGMGRGGGIIPARAGFTGFLQVRLGGLADHPRSRGVYLGPKERRFGLVGSSPLARGLLFMHMFQITFHRIIPARAGFTLCHH